MKKWIEIKRFLWPNEVKSHFLEVCVNVNCLLHTPTYGYRACFVFVLRLMSGNPQDSLCTDSLSKIFREATWIEEGLLNPDTILLELILKDFQVMFLNDFRSIKTSLLNALLTTGH